MTRWPGRACGRSVSARAAEHVVDGPTAYLLFQTLVGAWPIDEQRLTGYLEKAMREAKRHTSWNDPDPAYEGRVLDLARACLSDAALVAQVEERAGRPRRRDHGDDAGGQGAAADAAGRSRCLPGHASGSALTLVDPDNRRPVEVRARRSADDR